YPGNVQQVADELDLGLDGALDPFECEVVIFLLDLPSAQHAGPAQHRRQRRAELVRKQGEKLVLRAVRILRRAARRIFTLEEPFALPLDPLAFSNVPVRLQRQSVPAEFDERHATLDYDLAPALCAVAQLTFPSPGEPERIQEGVQALD